MSVTRVVRCVTLPAAEAVQAFSSAVADRCTDGPLVPEATTLGEYPG